MPCCLVKPDIDLEFPFEIGLLDLGLENIHGRDGSTVIARSIVTS
jgi:hypothetical protein